jgi:GH15 family glucan-1,4-alpha-glucosidase
MYPYGIVGNCQMTALIDEKASVRWLCWPRPDSEPVFASLLDSKGGEFSISLESEERSHSYYLPNTNILRTEISSADGAVRITDFCPRFEQYGRMYRPLLLMRKVEILRGSPKLKVRIDPISGWAKTPLKAERGNSHLRFVHGNDEIRLLTNMSLTHLLEGNSVTLSENLYFALSWSLPVEGNLTEICEGFLDKTRRYWQLWVKHCNIPSLFQDEAIRSALALKLQVYEDTGAILAAPTTSLPEEHGSTRNWDYRFCWLRDAYFVLSAFHNLGHFEEMEGFLKFLLELSRSSTTLAPVYTLDGKLPLPELSHENWEGAHGARPVRSGNLAANQVQNDVYGEMILSLSPIYFDERFADLRSADLEHLLSRLALQAADSIGKSDAGLWEFRDGWREHSFTNLMSWAGLERLHRLSRSSKLKLDLSEAQVAGFLEAAEARLLAAVKDASMRNGPSDESWDASLLLLGTLRFPDQNLARKTTEIIESELSLAEAFLYRYRRKDDFGEPQSAFLICSFWLIQAWGQLGQREKAVRLLEKTLAAKNHLGLFSEHYDSQTREQSGNFPQAYSHVGLINAAFSVSPPWNEIL